MSPLIIAHYQHDDLSTQHVSEKHEHKLSPQISVSAHLCKGKKQKRRAKKQILFRHAPFALPCTRRPDDLIRSCTLSCMLSPKQVGLHPHEQQIRPPVLRVMLLMMQP